MELLSTKHFAKQGTEYQLGLMYIEMVAVLQMLAPFYHFMIFLHWCPVFIALGYRAWSA